MAHFHKIPSGERISCQPITVTKSSITIGLWGYLDFDKQELDVIPDNPAVRAKPDKITGNSREWLITTTACVRTRLEARTKSGAVWDWVELTFMAVQGATQSGSIVRPEDRAEVIAAARAGVIYGGAKQQLLAVDQNGSFNDGQHQFVLADRMFAVLAALSRAGQLSLVSLMRYNKGPHGKVQQGGVAICTAMDIGAYAGFKINLINGENVDNTIAGIAAVIRNLPTGLYALGLTRPSPYPEGPPMPDKDIFLPCNNTDWPMYKPGLPLPNPTPQFVNKAAAAEINAALNENSRASMHRMFQDGPDHLHLEVIRASSA